MDGENKRKREREKEAITGQPIKYPFTSPISLNRIKRNYHRNFALRINHLKEKKNLKKLLLDILEYFFRGCERGVYLESVTKSVTERGTLENERERERDTRGTMKGNDEEAKADKSAALVRISYRSILQRR